MNFFESIILGIVQGLTEFLPVSSSGHLVIFQNLFGISSKSVAFEIVVHIGTLLSILVVFYSDLINMIKSFFTGIFKGNIVESYKSDYHFRFSILIIIGTIPAIIVGLFFKDFLESIFHNISIVGFTLIFTGLILFLTRFIKVKQGNPNMFQAIIIGITQAFAILPGISRSGMTISTSLFLGISRDEAARFSFLLSIPAILGAAVLELNDFVLDGLSFYNFGVLFAGMFFSFIVGYVAIKFLLKVIQTGKFSWFAPYCVCLGIIVLFWLR